MSGCVFCEEDFFFADANRLYGCDVLQSEWEQFLVWHPCCGGMLDSVEAHGFEFCYGVSVEHVAGLLGYDVVEVLGDGDGCVVARLSVYDPTASPAPKKAKSPSGWRGEVFKLIDEHHSHHDSPTGWKFGVAVYNGGVRVGVAVVGNPVARRYMEAHPGALEVTRCCVLPARRELRKNTASKLYAAAARRAKLLGYNRLVTYTLAEESGHSLIASGWTPTRLSRAENWNRPSRERATVTSSKGSTAGAKVRWERGLTKSERRSVAAAQIELAP